MVSILNIGDVIILELKNSEKLERYRCKLVERDENKLYIDYPINQETNKSAFLLDGTQLKGTFVVSDGSVYLFDGEIIGRVKKNIPMLILSYPGKEHLVKIQRRQYVRIETSVDAAIHPNDIEFKPFTVVTDDISAGGASFQTIRNDILKKGMVIQIFLVLTLQNGEYHYLKFKSKIIRTIPINEDRTKVSIQFIEVTSYERQLLLRFSFDRQVALKRKGLDI